MISDASGACFDTEFLREKTYHPLLCLAQVLCGDTMMLIDPLTDADYSALWPALLDTPLTLHSCRQDMEVMNITTGRLPSRVFDTQIAAGLIGKTPQIGYAALVKDICGVSLDKAHTRTDWSRRPLSASVREYAADDVLYLPQIESELREALSASGRLGWAEEDNADLLDKRLYEVDVSEAWQRVKGLGRTPEIVQQRVRALATWRETTAQQKNRPRQWIARDDALIGISFEAPESVAAMADIQGINPKFVDRYGRKLLDVLHGELPEPPIFAGRPDDAERARVKAMAKAVKAIATELGVEAEILAPQRELRQAARGDTELRALRGWRKDIVGDAITALLP